MTKKKKEFGFIFCPAWEYDIVIEDGIWNFGGSVIFVNKSHAEELGRKIGKINMPNEFKEISLDGQTKKIPIIQEFEYFYVMSIDIALLKEMTYSSVQFLDDSLDKNIKEPLPPVWFVPERIPPECIIHSEKTLI